MHIPVLKERVLKCLNVQPNQNFIDATYGLGGHSQAILRENRPQGKVLAIEITKELYQKAKEQNIERLILVNDSYANLEMIVKQHNFQPINGILFDLGMSKWHLEHSNRGFSFQKDQPLDMRYLVPDLCQTCARVMPGYSLAPITPITASEIINSWPTKEIEKILRDYGQERFGQRIAQKIIEARRQKPIKTTFQLIEIIKQAIPKRLQRTKIHPATRTFQALRIAVNNELENIAKALPQALKALAKGGRLAAISFHSLEDRIIKNFFKQSANKGLIQIITKKPIIPDQKEISQNLSSRSAKLRVCQKI